MNNEIERRSSCSSSSREYDQIRFSLTPQKKVRPHTNRVPVFTEMNLYEKELFKAKLEQDLFQAG